ncbi:MAG: PAS domain S-box protein [Anaerolineae bacterium]|nr:PAS domain S-box protein [Anaerolineae bacterium]
MDGDDQRLSDIRAWLSNEGLKLFGTSNGAKALQILNSYPVPLVLLGHNLSDGDGIELCAHIKAGKQTAAIPVLMVGAQDSNWIDAAFEAGADDVCLFPTHEAILRNRVRRLAEMAEQRQELVESQRRAHQLFHESRAVMLLVDPQTGNIVDANRAAYAFYGYPQKQLMTMSLADLDAPAQKNTEPLQTTNITLRHRLANGECRDIAVFSGPIEVGDQRYVCMIIHDVTKRKLAQVAETRQRAMAEALREIAADIVKTLDHDEVLNRIFANMQHIIEFRGASIMLVDGSVARTRRLEGYGDLGAEMSIIENLRLPIDTTYTMSIVIETGTPIIIPDVQKESRWERVPGFEWIRSHITAPIHLGNRTIGFLNVDSEQPNVYTDADSERLQAFADQAAIALNNADMYRRINDQAARLEARVRERTAELEHERAQLNAILDSMTEGVIYAEPVNGSMRVRFVNAALIALTGYEDDEWLVDAPPIFMQQDQNGQKFADVARSVVKRLSNQARWQIEAHVPRKDGTYFLASISAARLVDPQGTLIGLVGVARDISKEKALAEQRSRFVAHASHELRTPLTNAKTRLYLLRRQPEKAADHLGVLEAVVDNMRELVEDMLDLSRLERSLMSLNRQNVDLGPFISGLVDLQGAEAERKSITLRHETPDAPVMAYVDNKRLAQVITNLLINAINYTAPGGTITARLLPNNVDALLGTCARIEIEDNGIGISEENLESVFQPFFRVPSEVQGTGLGLSIAREIIQLHGGEIHVSSTLGQGSTFIIVLPQLMSEAYTLTEAEA